MKNDWEIVSVKPGFGVNYNRGWLGFTFTQKSFVSSGIAWFTRFEEGDNKALPDIPISHVVVVSGPDECVEAAIPKVLRGPLSHYFEDPNTHIVFRKPVSWDAAKADLTVMQAETRVGQSYDYPLFVGHFLNENVLGRLFSILSFGLSKKAVYALLNRKNGLICSELGAWALAQSGYKLDKKPASYTPQTLFQDPSLGPLDWTPLPKKAA